MLEGSISLTLMRIPEYRSGRLQPITRHTWTGREECTPCQQVSFSLLQRNIFKAVPKLWTISTSGQRPDKNTIFSSRRSSDCLISGRTWPRRPLLVSWLQVVTPLSSLLCGSIFSVVLGRHRNSLIATLTSLWSVVLWLLPQPAGWPFHLRMLEELTMPIRPGQLSSEETIPLLLKLFAESHSKRDHHTFWRAVSQLLSINSSSGRLTWTSTSSWRISSSSSGSTMMSAMNGVNSSSRPVLSS